MLTIIVVTLVVLCILTTLIIFSVLIVGSGADRLHDRMMREYVGATYCVMTNSLDELDDEYVCNDAGEVIVGNYVCISNLIKLYIDRYPKSTIVSSESIPEYLDSTLYVYDPSKHPMFTIAGGIDGNNTE